MTPNEILATNVVIVLVQPQYPGNVGACARAMKNMGLRRLVIVDPPAFDPERTRWMAPGCADLIAEARLVGTLDEEAALVSQATQSGVVPIVIQEPVYLFVDLFTRFSKVKEMSHHQLGVRLFHDSKILEKLLVRALDGLGNIKEDGLARE